MARFPAPSIHGVESIAATVKVIGDPPFTLLRLLIQGDGDEPVTMDVFMPSTSEDYARRLANAINDATDERT